MHTKQHTSTHFLAASDPLLPCNPAVLNAAQVILSPFMTMQGVYWYGTHLGHVLQLSSSFITTEFETCQRSRYPTDHVDGFVLASSVQTSQNDAHFLLALQWLCQEGRPPFFEKRPLGQERNG